MCTSITSFGFRTAVYRSFTVHEKATPVSFNYMRSTMIKCRWKPISSKKRGKVHCCHDFSSRIFHRTEPLRTLFDSIHWMPRNRMAKPFLRSCESVGINRYATQQFRCHQTIEFDCCLVSPDRWILTGAYSCRWNHPGRSERASLFHWFRGNKSSRKALLPVGRIPSIGATLFSFKNLDGATRTNSRKSNVCHVKMHAVTATLNSVLLMEATTCWNVGDLRFHIRHFTTARRNLVKENDVSNLVYSCFGSGVINDNLPFRLWIENRSMPYIDYFTVPLEGKSTGETTGHIWEDHWDFFQNDMLRRDSICQRILVHRLIADMLLLTSSSADRLQTGRWHSLKDNVSSVDNTEGMKWNEKFWPWYSRTFSTDLCLTPAECHSSFPLD